MNWADFAYGVLSGIFLFVGATGGVGYYVSRHPHALTRALMKRTFHENRKRREQRPAA